jgi:Xaa-Pro aminopeptidase
MTDGRHARRRADLGAVLGASTDRELDAALVTSLVNVRYLTGLPSSNAALLVRPDGSAVLATDDRYAEAAAQTCPDVVVEVQRDVAAALAARASREGVARLGVERHDLTLLRNDAVAAAAGDEVTLGDLGEAVESLRAVKDAAEVAAVAAACAIADAALLAVLEAGLAGRTEAQVARDLEARMLLGGAEAVAFETIVAAGPFGSVPHHSPGPRVIERGDLVTIDFGARVDGYHSDCTRTVVVGEPADWQREVYGVVQAAQQAGVDALAVGVSTADVDRAARSVVERAGYGEFFTHGLGHGVGLMIHEPPWLSASAALASTLTGRSTLTVEPGIYLPGRGGVRIEDTVDVAGDHDGGVAVLTGTTKTLLVVD